MDLFTLAILGAIYVYPDEKGRKAKKGKKSEDRINRIIKLTL